jgi:hypothetical protein
MSVTPRNHEIPEIRETPRTAGTCEIPGITGMCVMARKRETPGTEEVTTEKAGTEVLTALTGTEVVALNVSETEDRAV